MGEHQDECLFWGHFAHAQVERLQRCIDENKWYLSQKAGYDVGPRVAEADFIRNHANRVAAEFRVEFCQRQCAGRELCRLAALVDDLNRFWDEANPTQGTAHPAPHADRAVAEATALLPEVTPAALPASGLSEKVQQPSQVSLTEA